MPSGFTIKGMDGLDAHLAKLARTAAPETMQMLREAGEDVRAAVKPALPRKTGAFQESGRVEDRGDDAVEVAFDGHYPGQSKGIIRKVAKRTAKAAVEARAPDLAAALKVR